MTPFTVLKVIFEIFSAIFVVTSLIVIIYSDYALARFIAVICLMFIVSAITYVIMRRLDKDDDQE